MKTMTLDAKASVLTDKGEVRLLVSTYDVDRGGDAVMPGAWAKTLARWRAANNRPPLAWNHDTGNPRAIIGSVDPHSMHEVEGEGLVVDAKLDLAGSEMARDAFRLVKEGALGVSFGYTAKSQEQPDGTRLLTEIDLMEISLTATPMNPGARVLSHKGTAIADESKPAPSGELEWLHNFLQRDPEDVVREHLAQKQAEAIAERKSRGPIKVASFGVEVQ